MSKFKPGTPRAFFGEVYDALMRPGEYVKPPLSATGNPGTGRIKIKRDGRTYVITVKEKKR